MRLFEPKLMTWLGSKILHALKNDSFIVSFIHLELKREHKEDYMKVKENKAWIGL